MPGGESKRDAIAFAARVLLGAIFAAAGILKDASMHSFILTVSAYDIVSIRLVPAFAVAVVSLEISFGFTLTAGFFSRLSAAVLSFLSLIFLIAVVVEITRGNNGACGCFGSVVREKIGLTSTVRDFLLFSIGIWLSTKRTHRWSVDELIKMKSRTGLAD
ncbi:MAG: DoxX family membrane protein [Bacteroidetes bacterium]|nr:DoxX family membrane protein [Bacteroidota bacterium]